MNNKKLPLFKLIVVLNFLFCFSKVSEEDWLITRVFYFAVQLLRTSQVSQKYFTIFKSVLMHVDNGKEKWKTNFLKFIKCNFTMFNSICMLSKKLIKWNKTFVFFRWVKWAKIIDLSSKELNRLMLSFC